MGEFRNVALGFPTALMGGALVVVVGFWVLVPAGAAGAHGPGHHGHPAHAPGHHGHPAHDAHTEPPFLLQGSYRTMTRIAARLLRDAPAAPAFAARCGAVVSRCRTAPRRR